MNGLSWLIYLAGVTGSLSVFCAIVFICCCLTLIGCVISIFITDGEVFDNNTWRKLVTRIVFAAVVTFLVGSFIPSRDTVYAIAASEMGEEVLNSETGSLATQALNAWLRRQITPAPDTEN